MLRYGHHQPLRIFTGRTCMRDDIAEGRAMAAESHRRQLAATPLTMPAQCRSRMPSFTRARLSTRPGLILMMISGREVNADFKRHMGRWVDGAIFMMPAPFDYRKELDAKCRIFHAEFHEMAASPARPMRI